MRLLRMEAEGGITIVEWDGGFVGICANDANQHKFEVQAERCPCCRGAFDIRIKILGIEVVAYNDGAACDLEAYLEEIDDEWATIQPVPQSIAEQPLWATGTATKLNRSPVNQATS